MEILPRTLGTRPRLACEVRAEGVVAARAEDAMAVLSAVSQVALGQGLVIHHVRSGDAAGPVEAAATQADGGAGRALVVGAVRRALDAVCLRTREVTLVVPDSAVRVLLLDFDSLPAKAAEALHLVRFRLKKLLPFDAEDAAVSYQVMSSAKGVVQVLAVAMPRDVQDEYEGVVRDAGYEPGAVLPSTLAALAGLSERESPTLVVNAGKDGVTTAIVKSGVLLLHRTVDLGSEPGATGGGAAPANEVAQAVSVAAAYFEDTLETTPAVVLTAGTMGAEALIGVIDASGVGIGPVAVQEMLDRQMLGPGAETAGTQSGIPLGWLAGVRGALAN